MTSSPISTIGIFGGSFDPIHLGHLILARDVLEQMGLKRILFIPAAQAPLSANEPKASGADRLELVRAAIATETAFSVSELELQAGGINYTIDTMQMLQDEYPDERLSLIIGSDQLAQLPQWQNIDKLLEMIELICLERPGFPLHPPKDLGDFKWRSAKPRMLAISSTEIRQRIRNGLSIRHLVPDPVLQMINAGGLYSDTAESL